MSRSGCGRVTNGRLLMHLIHPDEGSSSPSAASGSGLAAPSPGGPHRQMQMVFQDSFSSLNPRLPNSTRSPFGPMVHGLSAAAALVARSSCWARSGSTRRLFANRYPHELSGGQRSASTSPRAGAQPSLVILDGRTRALENHVEAQGLNLLMDLKGNASTDLCLHPHDLNVGAM